MNAVLVGGGEGGCSCISGKKGKGIREIDNLRSVSTLEGSEGKTMVPNSSSESASAQLAAQLAGTFTRYTSRLQLSMSRVSTL